MSVQVDIITANEKRKDMRNERMIVMPVYGADFMDVDLMINELTL